MLIAASRDDGRTWADIPAALPSLDIHGFARDPDDPSRMWAYLATGGPWESRDGGLAWEMVQQQNVLVPVAVRVAGGTRLFGVTVNGLASSDDGGQTIAVVTRSTDYFRSDDGGRTWPAT